MNHASAAGLVLHGGVRPVLQQHGTRDFGLLEERRSSAHCLCVEELAACVDWIYSRSLMCGWNEAEENWAAGPMPTLL